MTQSYAPRGAIINAQYNCQRKGTYGFRSTIRSTASFTADAFTAKATTGTSFSTPDDYTMIRDLTGKRVGNCPAAGAAAKS